MALIDKISQFKDQSDKAEKTALEQQDCLSCRVLGSAVFAGLGGYTYFSGMQQLRKQQSTITVNVPKYKFAAQRLGIVSLSAALFGLGIYRAIN